MKDKEKDLVVLSVSLSSGKFESIIRYPIDTPEEDIKELVSSWIRMSQAALKCGKDSEIPIPKIEESK